MGKIAALGVIAMLVCTTPLLAQPLLPADGGVIILAQARFKEFKPLPGEQVIRGEISKIEKEAYIIKDTDGKEVRLKVTDQTIIRDEFKPGDQVQAHVDKSGVASVIKYMPPDKTEGQRSPGTGRDSKAPQSGVLPHTDLSQDSATQLLPGHTIVKGTVEEIKGEMIRVNLGDLKTRPLSLKQAQDQGAASLKEGDQVNIIINAENGVVDFYREGDPPKHRILHGRIAEIADDVEWAEIIADNGEKLRLSVQSEARSRIKRAYTGAPAMFLVGEDKILDAVPENAPEIQLPAGKEREKETGKETTKKPESGQPRQK
jgi:Cu/Ag efflux protein CusF